MELLKAELYEALNEWKIKQSEYNNVINWINIIQSSEALLK